MCGIAGILGRNTPLPVLDRMLVTMARRGPDDSGIYREAGVQLLHSRLAIVDPQRGVQPMKLSFDGENYVLVYNGELYNTPELRRELIELGHSFTTHCDTEVVLHGYAQWGEGCLEKFNGIFGFAVWHCREKKLFLARDRMGVKPLFYAALSGGFVFASEIKTILAQGEVKPILDREGAAQLLLLGPGRLPGSGVFHSIEELEPGCCGSYVNGKWNVKRYWKLRDREHRDSLGKTLETVRYLVTDAICRQMVSDVGIGCFLSGGLDSSIITAVCSNTMKEKGIELPTFSVDYKGSERYFTANAFQPESDNDYIRIMEANFHTRHHWTVLEPEELEEALYKAVLARDLPGMADVDSSLLCFCGQIRKDVKVALSGECADEIFGGYPWYRDPKIRSQAGFPWAQNTLQRAGLMTQSLRRLVNPEEFVMDAYTDTCRESDVLPGTTAEDRRIKEMVNLNFRWFMQTLLDRKDRMSMYHSLEVRVPFCDYRIAEYLYGVSWNFKELGGKEKGLLRQAVKGLLPEKVQYRKKNPYPKTFDPRYEALVENKLNELMEKDVPLWSLADKSTVSTCLNTDSPWPWYGQLMRRPQTIAYLLQLNYWLEEYKVELKF